MAGECSAEQAMVQMIAVRVTTARKLMHKKPEGRSNRAQERGPHRSREQVRILKEVGTLKAALISVGKPGQASAAAMQCLAEFKTLFLASTVSALHRNAHIWNASHSLLGTYYCWVTVYSPSMEAQKKSHKYMVDSRTRTSGICEYKACGCQLCHFVNRTQWVVLLSQQMPINLNFNSQLVENRKFQLTPKITNHLFTCYLNCMCKSKSVFLIQQWSVIFLSASYVQWLYFLVWAYEN